MRKKHILGIADVNTNSISTPDEENMARVRPIDESRVKKLVKELYANPESHKRPGIVWLKDTGLLLKN